MIRSLTEALPPLAATIEPLGDDPRAAIAAVRAMGYRAVQLSATQPGMRPRELDAGARRGLRSALARDGLACGGIDAWIPPSHLVEPAQVDRALAALEGACGLAADLGRCVVCTALPRDVSPEVLQEVVRMADRHGVRIADFSGDSPGVGVPREVVGVGVDPAAMIGAGIEPAARVAALGRDVAAARVVDLLDSGMRGPPGERSGARLDLPAFAAALALSGANPPCCADARQWADPAGGLRASLSRWCGAADPVTDHGRARVPHAFGLQPPAGGSR